MQVVVTIDDASEAGRYFAACARIRDISATQLVRRMVDVIASDQLVLSILDDGSKPQPKQKHQHGFRERPGLPT